MNEESAMEQIDETPRGATLVLLPKKSRQQYKIAFKNVLQWYEEKSVSEKCTENVVLTYFKDCSQDWKFLIKTMRYINTNVDISKYVIHRFFKTARATSLKF